MRNQKYLMLIMLLLIITSCTKPYFPYIETTDSKKYMVSGQVNTGDGMQTVNVSLTSSINNPQYLPLTGCTVNIIDDKGIKYLMTDLNDGYYFTWIDPAVLRPGSSFMVEISVPNGDILVSDYDQMPMGPQIDSVYYLLEDIEGNIPGQLTQGIQFYLDLILNSGTGRYFRWEVFETWEYHADYPLEWYYDGAIHHVSPPDYSRKVCWKTLKRPEIFTLSANNLSLDRYTMLPLQYIDNLSSRLEYGYSMLVKQYSLSESAYIYWDQLRINSSIDGGLYEQQPLAIKGNLVNLSHPDEEVLGFFSAATLSTKRIFVSNTGLPLEFSTYCTPSLLERGYVELSPRYYPAYIMGNENGPTWMWMNNECVDCLLLGGINTKPEFWPN